MHFFWTFLAYFFYSYVVTDIRYENHADQVALHREESALTLFIKNIYAFEYLIIYCNPVQ